MTIDMKMLAEKWQKKWKESGVYKTQESNGKPKFYILDMFPYPSGAGLHVGHPKGYVASDTIARKKMLEGYNVLHPMGFDTFGLGTEQYAIDHKMKPQTVAEQNIATYISQLEKIGFTYDWERSFSTADPEYYKWTQSIFLKFYTHYYDEAEGKAKPISVLEEKLKKEGKSESEIRFILDSERLAYLDYKPINRCPHCKTGLANEDLDDGKCERCGSEVEQKPMRQWVLRITKYAQRLLDGLDTLDWDESMKELERNWIGKSEGTQFQMKVQNSDDIFEIYTTRIDTVFGMSFVVMAPEHPLVEKITIPEQKEAVRAYQEQAKYKTQLERAELQKEKTWVFTGAYAINPFNNQEVPIYIGDYVLANYGTGVVMAVPAHDERDFDFAKQYGLKIQESVQPLLSLEEPELDQRSEWLYLILKDAKSWKVLVLKNQDGVSFPVVELEWTDWVFFTAANQFFEKKWIKAEYQHMLGDAIHLQRENHYVIWGIEYLCNAAQCECSLDEEGLCWIDWKDLETSIDTPSAKLFLDRFLYGEKAYTEKGVLVNSWQFSGLKSDEAIAKMQAWLTEQGIGWKKVNYKIQDRVFSRQRYWGEPFPVVFCEEHGVVPLQESGLPLCLPDVEHYEPTGTEEGPLAEVKDWIETTCPICWKPAKRESNTMPGWAGSSWYWLRYMDPKNSDQLVAPDKEAYWGMVDTYVWGAEHVTRHMIYARFWQNFLYDLGIVSHPEPFKKYQKVWLIMAEDGRKMSKRRGNVVNPDDIIAEYGADVLRTYEMFMGPFDQAIAWNTQGMKWVKKFLDKVIALYDKVDIQSSEENSEVTTLLHQTIKKLTEEIDDFRFNTSLSQLMILVNRLWEEEKISKKTFESLVLMLAPFAPHLAEEFWNLMGNEFSIFTTGKWPTYDPAKLVSSRIVLPVQFNGKMRWTLEISPESSQEEILAMIRQDEKLANYLTGEIKKCILVPWKIINIIV